jgi:hypothetical protein
MSTAIFEAKASGMATKNDALRDAFAIDAVRCFLLKRDEYSSIFVAVGSELTSGYRVEFDDNRSLSGLLRYASTDLAFRNTWAASTHLGYGVPASSKIEVYEFSAEEPKDSIDPDGKSVYWSGRIIKVPNERYTIV